MRVLLVASKYPPEYAGAGLRLHRTYLRLADGGGIERRVICNSVEFTGDREYVHEGVPVRRVSSSLFRDWERAPAGLPRRLLFALKAYAEGARTLALLARERSDLVHVVGTSASPAVAILWARALGLPLVIELVTAKASPWQPLPGLSRIWRPALDRRTLIVAISEPLRERCESQGLVENVWCRPNPVDETRFTPDPEERARIRRALTPFADGDRVLAAVAKFMPQKNQLFLVDVLSRLPARYKLVLAGPLVSSGPLAPRDRAYLGRIRARIAELGLEGRVLLRPEFVDAAAYMRLADVYLMPNTTEGLGTPLLEAQASGLPVVANREEASFHGWIEEGRNGFLRPLDASLWAEAILRAEAIPAAAIAEAAERVRKMASTSATDRAFRALLKALVALPEGGTLDVAAVLGRRGGGAEEGPS